MPAWPIPIHQTKLTIAKPHAAGIRMPQIPTPLIINRVTTMFNNIRRAKPMRKPNTQPGVTGRVRTIALILSVTLSNVWPGANKRFWLSNCSYFLRTFRIHAVSPALVTDACCLSL